MVFYFRSCIKTRLPLTTVKVLLHAECVPARFRCNGILNEQRRAQRVNTLDKEVLIRIHDIFEHEKHTNNRSHTSNTNRSHLSVKTERPEFGELPSRKSPNYKLYIDHKLHVFKAKCDSYMDIKIAKMKSEINHARQQMGQTQIRLPPIKFTNQRLRPHTAQANHQMVGFALERSTSIFF